MLLLLLPSIHAGVREASEGPISASQHTSWPPDTEIFGAWCSKASGMLSLNGGTSERIQKWQPGASSGWPSPRRAQGGGCFAEVHFLRSNGLMKKQDGNGYESKT